MLLLPPLWKMGLSALLVKATTGADGGILRRSTRQPPGVRVHSTRLCAPADHRTVAAGCNICQNADSMCTVHTVACVTIDVTMSSRCRARFHFGPARGLLFIFGPWSTLLLPPEHHLNVLGNFSES